jgi:hypothetical protein
MKFTCESCVYLTNPGKHYDRVLTVLPDVLKERSWLVDEKQNNKNKK